MSKAAVRLTLVCLAVVSVGARLTPAAESSAAIDGKSLYESVGCWACHGFAGQGASSRGIASGPRIQARIYPRDAFFAQLRQPVGSMPPYTGKVLSDAEVDAIFAYLKSVPEPRAREAIPELRR